MLCNELHNMDQSVKISGLIHINQHLREAEPGIHHSREVSRIRSKLRHITNTINHASERRSIKKFAPHIIHATYYNPIKTDHGCAKSVITVFDMIHELYPEQMSTDKGISESKRKAVLSADHVICISESTQRDLCRLIDINPSKTSVVHLGFNTATHNPPNCLENRRPYLLYVGNRSGYKNFTSTLNAFGRSLAIKDNFDLIAFGGGKFSGDELKAAAKAGIEPTKLIHASGSDDVLFSLYQGASAFVYPSLYEGFGLPPLEAMSLNCPVVCSNTSSLPEVVGTAAELFDPLDVESQTRALEKVLFDADRQEELARLGSERIKLFSWRRCATETLSCYKQISAD
jgi:glycosyltransferase involved in cell wall biosynthesis